MDQEVLDCIEDLKFYLSYNTGNSKKKEEYFRELERKYNDLTREQQELVNIEYYKIIETQNKKNVKKKGMIKYE